MVFLLQNRGRSAGGFDPAALAPQRSRAQSTRRRSYNITNSRFYSVAYYRRARVRRVSVQYAPLIICMCANTYVRFSSSARTGKAGENVRHPGRRRVGSPRVWYRHARFHAATARGQIGTTARGEVPGPESVAVVIVVFCIIVAHVLLLLFIIVVVISRESQ